ncbi:MAG: hypothetical protein ACKVOB_03540, partial [Sphingomonas sp.]
MAIAPTAQSTSQRDLGDVGLSPLWSGLARLGGALPSPLPTAPETENAAAQTTDADAISLPAARLAVAQPVRPASLRYPAQGPRFDVSVAPGGYAWWYIDATSDDGAHGLTIIAFIGSVFSPYYKASGRQCPENFCALNVSLNGPRGGAWAMTERSAAGLARDANTLIIGPSALHWDGDCLTIDINEVSAPLPYPVRGQVRVYPAHIGATGFHLDPAGRHRWHPIAPRARVEVAMAAPGISWSGGGYFDSNFGEESLEDGFVDWHWSRAHLARDVAVLYEGTRRSGQPFELALRMDAAGNWEDVVPPPALPLARSAWGISRVTRADAGARPHVTRTWIDAPFYARSALDTTLFGERVGAV